MGGGGGGGGGSSGHDDKVCVYNTNTEFHSGFVSPAKQKRGICTAFWCRRRRRRKLFCV